MKIKDIYEIRILPPMAIGRLGGAEEPMDNYAWVIPETASARKIVRADTLKVNKKTGEVSLDKSKKDKPISFKDEKGLIHPVAPFLELWASFSKGGELEPLTVSHLNDLGLTPQDIHWEVTVGNIKAFRRTEDKDDKIIADTGFFDDHQIHPLLGRSKNFLPGKVLPLGHVQYIRPNKAFPEIRFRFTPAAGYVYGSSKSKGDPEVSPVHNPASEVAHVKDRLIDSKKSKWKGYHDAPLNNPVNGEKVESTNPTNIFAGHNIRTKRGELWVSLGYIDDECDGIVNVSIALNGKNLTSYAHIVAGPPAFAPDHVPVRTVADELEQAMHGPNPKTFEASEIKDILRRALETTSLLNVQQMNQNEGMAQIFTGNGPGYRADEPIMDPSVADTLAIVARHESILLTLEASGLAWFARVLRNYNEVGDVSTLGQRKMPALMRGADGSHLALTRRQVAKIKLAAEQTANSDKNMLTKKEQK